MYVIQYFVVIFVTGSSDLSDRSGVNSGMGDVPGNPLQHTAFTATRNTLQHCPCHMCFALMHCNVVPCHMCVVFLTYHICMYIYFALGAFLTCPKYIYNVYTQACPAWPPANSSTLKCRIGYRKESGNPENLHQLGDKRSCNDFSQARVL